MSCSYPSRGVSSAACWVSEVPRVSLDTVIGQVTILIIDNSLSRVNNTIQVSICPSDLTVDNNRLPSRCNSWTSKDSAWSGRRRVTSSSTILRPDYSIDPGIKLGIRIIIHKAYRTRRKE